jgi:hypothetical protein
MLRVILTGATGMVGEGVLHECLLHPDVEAVLVVGRKPCGAVHSKLKEVLVKDFFDLTAIESQLEPYDACFFCLGVSSLGMKEPEYHKLTYELTLNFARVLSTRNRDMTFCYVSGASTDSSEKGRLMWARVKGKTENDLAKLPFKKVYNFRPGFMRPTQGLKNTLSAYRYMGWLYPMLKVLFPTRMSTLAEVGQAMVRAARDGYEKQILEVSDILILAARK